MQLHGGVPVDAGQLLAAAGLVGVGLQFFPQLALFLRRVGQGVFQGAVLLQQAHGGLVPHPGNAGDVVAGVPGHALPVGDLLRAEAVGLPHGLRGKAHGVGDALAGEHQFRHPVHQLQGVPVPGEQQGLDPHALPLQGQGAQQVVRLVALEGILPDAQLRQQLPNELELAHQLRGRGGAPSLVIRVGHMAEGGAVLVKAHGAVADVLLPHHLEQHGQKAVDSVGIHAAIAHQGQGVESPVHQAVAVNEQKCVLHLVLPFRPGYRQYTTLCAPAPGPGQLP